MPVPISDNPRSSGTFRTSGDIAFTLRSAMSQTAVPEGRGIVGNQIRHGSRVLGLRPPRPSLELAL
ncbi:hypothetical protein BDW66DRAFT_140299 [Aspergillus desertorum]